MCGIAGYVAAGSPSPDILVRAERALVHRGPDDGGMVRLPFTESTGEVGLAARRLAILDLSPSGHQPMTDPDSGNWIAYNGEIYNFGEIRKKLESEGVRFSGTGDTEVILKAYGRWGRRCLQEFRGMFAFAIWDKAEQALFVARDRLGIKPLYYYANGGRFYFASEVRALLATGVVPRNISVAGLMNYVSFGSVYDPDTLIDGVSSLPPGSYLVWKNGTFEISEYWDPIDSCQQNGQDFDGATDDELAAEIRSRLHEAFGLRMISDVPVSVFLSGGIDSGALVAMLADTSPRALHTFSIIFAEQDFSEAPYSRLIADRFQTDHHEILLQPQVFLDTIPEALAAMDQPSVDGLNSYVISREVRAAGFKVALSGLGGDEVFAGYDLFRQVPGLENIEARMKLLPQIARYALAAGIRNMPGPPMRMEKLASFMEPRSDALGAYVVARSLFPLRQHKKLVTNWTAEAFQAALAATTNWRERAQKLDPINRVSYLELRNYMLNTLLRDSDAMSMAHSIELRVPFLDHKLIEFVLSIPGSRKLNGSTPKYLLTKSLGGLLPEEVVHRPKRGFTLPFDTWLRKDAYADVNGAFLSWKKGAIAEYIDAEAANTVWKAFLCGKTTWSRVWALYVLHRWIQLHVEQQNESSLMMAEDMQSA
jgi:asparagine synthase (glutamine-hydrolysing)